MPWEGGYEPESDCAAIKTICTLNTLTDFPSFSLFLAKEFGFYEKTSNVFAFGLFSPSTELKLKKQKTPQALPLKMSTNCS